MRKLFLFTLLALITFVSFADELKKSATITGKLCDYKGSGYLFVMDSHKNTDTVKVDANGRFQHEIACNAIDSRHLVLDYLGKNKAFIDLYITPGAKTDVQLSGEFKEVEFFGEKEVKYVVTPVFSGDNARECDYINIPPYYDYYYVNKDGSPVTYKEFTKQVKARQDFLKSKLDGCSEVFRNETLKEIEGMQEQYLFAFARRSLYDAKNNASKDPDFVKEVSKIDVNDEALCENSGMSNQIEDYIWYDLTLAHPEYYEGKPYIEREMLYLKEKVSNAKVREYISDNTIDFYMVAGDCDGLIDAFPLYKELSGKSEKYKDNEKVFNSLRKLLPGVMATDFEMQDPNGNTVHFLDVVGKGKVTYIDFWATWCGPCCAEIPYVEKLVEHYKGNDKIEMLSISLDNNKKAWLSKLEQDKPTWRQYIIPTAFDSSFAKEYNIRAIPRFMIFDKDGKIVTINAERPSAKNIIEVLDGIINK